MSRTRRNAQLDQSVLQWKKIKDNEELKKENEWLRMQLEEKEEEERRANQKARNRSEQLTVEEAWRTKGLHDLILKKYMLDKKRKECLVLEQGLRDLSTALVAHGRSIKKKTDELEEAEEWAEIVKGERIAAAIALNSHKYEEQRQYARDCSSCNAINPLTRSLMVNCSHTICGLCVEQLHGESASLEIICPECGIISKPVTILELQKDSPQKRSNYIEEDSIPSKRCKSF